MSSRLAYLPDTLGPVGLAEAAAAYRSALNDLERARITLHAEIREALAAGMRQADIVRITGYTRETIRQIARED